MPQRSSWQADPNKTSSPLASSSPLRRGWRGTALGGFGGLGNRAADARESVAPTLGRYEETKVGRRPEAPVVLSPHDWNTLWGAAILGLANTTERLLKSGVSPDIRDANEATALMHGAEWGKPDVLAVLLSWGADPNAEDKNHRSAIFRAPGTLAPRTLAVLQSGGADINFLSAPLSPTGGQTALIEAVCAGQVARVEALLGAGANPNARNTHGFTALLYAALLKRTRIVQKLREAGAVSGFGEAVAGGEWERAAQFDADIRLDAPLLANGETLLSRAARRGDFALVRLLLERGANPDGAGMGTLVPLDGAAQASRGRVLRLLLDWGATPDLAATPNQTLLNWAGLRSEVRE